MSNKFRQRSMGLKRLSINQTKEGSLYNTTRRAFLCSRLMGFLPLSGLTSQKSDKLRYTLWSPYTVYYGFSLFGLLFMSLTTLNYLVQKNISINIISKVVFYTMGLISALALANICRRWPLLMKSVEVTERQLPDFGKYFHVNITLVSVFIMIASAVEYILFTSHGLHVVRLCYSNNITENFFKVMMPWIFDYTEFSVWKGVISEIYYIQATFIWNCTDMFLITISLYLAEYFVIHNKHLKRAVQQKHFLVGKFRTQYLKIAHLVKLVNDHFGIILVTSVTVNLYWICILLYFTINGNHKHYIVCGDNISQDSKYQFPVDHTMYFTYSVSYQIIRGLLVLLLAARINSNALVTMYILHDLPSSKYTCEVQRYISQIKNINIALSGLDFFYITRSMNLKLLGTVVTYEVVLFQLDK